MQDENLKFKKETTVNQVANLMLELAKLQIEFSPEAEIDNVTKAELTKKESKIWQKFYKLTEYK